MLRYARVGGMAVSVSSLLLLIAGGPQGSLTPAAASAATTAGVGALHGARLGPIALGEQRRTLRSRNPRLRVMSNRRFDNLCLAGGPGIRVGYLKGKAVVALTASRFYSYDGLRPGATVRAAKRALGQRLRGPVVLGPNAWYDVVLAKVFLVIKVRADRVQEIGIAERSPAGGRGQLGRLMRRLGA